MRKALFSMALILAAALCVSATAAFSDAATLYRWVDEQGVVHISGNPPEGKMEVAQAVVGEAGEKAPDARPLCRGEEGVPRPSGRGHRLRNAHERLETDPMFQLDAHLTRDFTEHFWGSFDTAWYTGGQATVSGVTGEALNNFGLGFSLGYTVNENLGLTVGYKSTIKDLDPQDLRMDNFTVSLVYGWHSLIEGAKRLRGGS